MRALLFIKNLFKKYPKLLISNIILVVIVGVIEACSLFTVGPLIDFLVHPDMKEVSSLTKRVMSAMDFIGLPVNLGIYLWIFAAFILLGSLFRILGRYSILKTKYAVLRDLMIGTFDDFFNARWYFFSSGKQGTLLNTFMREITVVGDAFGAIAYFFAGILQLICYLTVPFYISWQVTLISLGMVALLSLPFMLLGKISYRLGKLNTVTANKVGSVIQENITLSKVVLGFGNQYKSIKSFASSFDAHCKVTLKSQTISLAIPILYRPIGIFVLVIALLLAKLFGVTVSEMAVLLLALLQSILYVGDLTSRKNALDSFFPSYEQVNNLRRRAKQLKQKTGDKVFTGFKKEIIAEKVSFAYPGQKPVLIDMNIKIPKGKMIAIVGESGVGKSTFIDIIMGFNEPISGRIAFDGVDLKEFDINSYRRRIGYVPQDSVLFNMTISDNLRWAKEDATDEEIRQACHLANSEEFIEGFLEKYDTLVGDRGVRLSGGQCQRIALARAILRKPMLLILDEATSALDTHSERLIQRAIENIAKETTVIVIAHRLSTIVNADYVYVFKNGALIEEGTYSDLLKKDGNFNRMVKQQLLETTV